MSTGGATGGEATVVTATALTAQQIEAMTVPQMKLWLKERDVPVVPPIDADTLRAKVRHENGSAKPTLEDRR